MSIKPEPRDPGVPDWKHKLREEARKLLELQEQNRITRAAQLADRAHATALQEIKNTSIGK
jgi:hypothetical protein